MGFHSPNLLEDGYDIRYDSGIAGSQRRGDDDDPYSFARFFTEENLGRRVYTEPDINCSMLPRSLANDQRVNR